MIHVERKYLILSIFLTLVAFVSLYLGLRIRVHFSQLVYWFSSLVLISIYFIVSRVRYNDHYSFPIRLDNYLYGIILFWLGLNIFIFYVNGSEFISKLIEIRFNLILICITGFLVIFLHLNMKHVRRS